MKIWTITWDVHGQPWRLEVDSFDARTDQAMKDVHHALLPTHPEVQMQMRQVWEDVDLSGYEEGSHG